MNNIIDQLAKLAAKCAENDEATVESPYRRAEDYIAAIAEYLDEGGSGGGGGTFAPDITDPQDGDTLVYNATQQKWVNGAGGGGAGGVLKVNINQAGILDKTWQEIYDAASVGIVILSFSDDGIERYYYLTTVGQIESVYGVVFVQLYDGTNMSFATNSADGYPGVHQEPDSGDPN